MTLKPKSTYSCPSTEPDASEMVSFEVLLALLLQLTLQSLVHPESQPEEQLSHPELVLLFWQLLLHDEHPELVLLPSQLLLHPLHSDGSGSFVHELSMGVEASNAIPKMGRAFSEASLKNSLRDCSLLFCFISNVWFTIVFQFVRVGSLYRFGTYWTNRMTIASNAFFRLVIAGVEAKIPCIARVVCV